MRIDLLMFLFLPILGFIGASLSKQLKTTKNNRYAFILPFVTFSVGVAWTFVTKHTKMSLAVAQILFDTTYVLAYFFSFIILGESITFLQGIGVTLAISGMILLGL